MTKDFIGFENLSVGFDEPVGDSQAVFRRILDATAHPGRIVAVPPDILPEKDVGLSCAAAALALALLDLDTPVWLGADLADAGSFLRFHCGTRLVDSPSESRFAFVSDIQRLPALTEFDMGTPDFPERSTTLVIEVPDLADARGLELRGPGIRTSSHLRVGGVPDDFWHRRAVLAPLFPLGIDLVFTCGQRLAVLPRTTFVEI